MATHSRTRSDMTLEEFLQSPGIDDQPYQEYYDGRIEERITGAMSHSVLMSKLTSALDQYAKPLHLGMAFLALRCTFGNRSSVGDVIFLLDAQIRRDDRGEIEDETRAIPDIHIEIRSPDESVEKSHAKLMGSIADGCPLGWFVDPNCKAVDVFRTGFPTERLHADSFLDASPVLPGFRLAVAEVFGWLKYRRPNPNAPEADPR
jgi:Uma2 family endonuclease